MEQMEGVVRPQHHVASVNAAFWCLIALGRNSGNVVARAKDAPLPLHRRILQRILYYGSISPTNGDIRAAGCHCLVALDGERFFGDKRERSKRVFLEDR